MARPAKDDPSELRFNYLGFEYYPGKIKPFWESEEEKEAYLKKIRAKGIGYLSWEREFSLVNAQLLAKADRVVISLASLVMILSLVLPYYGFDAYGRHIAGAAVSYLAHVGYLSHFVAWGSPVLQLTFVLSIVLIIFSPLVGVVNLLRLNGKSSDDRYYEKVKAASRLNIFALALYFIFLIMAATGQATPFGSLGIDALGDHFNLGSVLAIASFGFWANIGAHILGMLPALEL